MLGIRSIAVKELIPVVLAATTFGASGQARWFSL